MQLSSLQEMQSLALPEFHSGWLARTGSCLEQVSCKAGREILEARKRYDVKVVGPGRYMGLLRPAYRLQIRKARRSLCSKGPLLFALGCCGLLSKLFLKGLSLLQTPHVNLRSSANNVV